MKARTACYWLTTIPIALETFVGGIMDLTHGRTAVFAGPSVATVVTSLGYPLYVLTIIGILKIPGAITLIVPGVPKLKEWAYAGIAFELAGAIASNALDGHTADLAAPTVLLGLAVASWALRPPSRVLCPSRLPVTSAQSSS